LLQSDPDIIISTLGQKESISVKSFTPDKFAQAYSAFITEMKNLSSKPDFIIVTPVYSSSTMTMALNINPPCWKREHSLPGRELTAYYYFTRNYKLNELDKNFFNSTEQLGTWDLRNVDMNELTFRVAKENGIPYEQVIDSDKTFTNGRIRHFMDSVHLNEKGHGTLAQEIYMRLAYAPRLKEKIQMIEE